MDQAVCSIHGCEQAAIARGWCHRHWRRWRKWGDPAYSRDERTPAERLWENVDRRGPDECWMWTGSSTHHGYGRFAIQRGDVRTTYRTHRFSYELHYGSVPFGMHVCHHCDNPPCCNPEHLFLGTNADNVADKVAKGRQPKPSARLTVEDVRAIRDACGGGESQASVARRYGLTRQGVGAVVRRRVWRDVA